MIAQNPRRRRLAATFAVYAMLLTAQLAIAQAQVYRCTAADGSIEFRQQACAGDEATERLDIEDTRTGWVPPKPEPEAPAKKTAAKSSAKKASSDKYAERCWKKRQQVQSINNELRAGYSPARGERLKRRRREYEAYINEYCR